MPKSLMSNEEIAEGLSSKSTAIDSSSLVDEYPFSMSKLTRYRLLALLMFISSNASSRSEKAAEGDVEVEVEVGEVEYETIMGAVKVGRLEWKQCPAGAESSSDIATTVNCESSIGKTD
jgi:hypothetical protein